MNSIDVVIREALLDVGISQKQLVEKLGYSNTNKSIRRLNHFIEIGECNNKEFVEKLMKLLRISPPVLKKAIDSVKQKLLEERKRLEEENFKQHIEVKFDDVPRPIFIAALAPKLWKIPISEEILDLDYEEELQEVVKLYKEHHRKYNGHFLGRATCTKFVGFRYFRFYDESILFDSEGGIVRIDEEHVSESLAYVRIK